MTYETQFRPLRPAPRRKLIAAIVVGPFLWVIALVLAAIAIHRTDAVGIALLIAGTSFAVAFLVLVVVRRGRRREERRYAAGR
jgi:xanthine/uracil permease